MTDSTRRGVVTLLKSALTGEKLSLPEGFELEKAYSIIKRHRIMSICYCGAVNCGIDEAHPVMQKLQSHTYAELIRGECQEWELRRVTAELKKCDIAFLPIKGLFIKELYPESHMRYMADADILIDEAKRSEAEGMLEKLGYRKYAESLCEIIYENDNLHLELHKALIPPHIKDFYAYFERPFERAERIDGSEYKFSDNDHFIYIFVHFARHYRGGGIGLKHLCDIFVCRDKLSLDEGYIEGEMQKLGLLDFYKNVCATADALFADGEESEITSLIANTVFESGAYGTAKNIRLSDTARRSKDGNVKKARRSHFWWSLFLPYGIMCIKYPFLKKAPFLLPFMWIVRAVAALFKKNSRTKTELKEIKGLSSDEVKAYIEGLHAVGLTFDF
ncbi:MAG: nucleotidyltransferase family protein [Clostridia bacterium]|nr:nucleotidyltransferase family protein [Clostridia bacterium]